MMWVNYGPITRLIVLVWLGAFVALTIQGLRNRPGPRWLGIFGVTAMISLMLDETWRIRAGCYSTAYLICWFTWSGAVIALFVHHALQPLAVGDANETARGIGKLAYRAVYPAFLSLPVAWAILNQIRVLLYDGENPDASYLAIVTVQRYIGWMIVALLPLAAVVSAHRLVIRLRRA